MLAMIVRILGTENPPRDLPGKRAAALQAILQTEPEFADVGKHYLLNRIWDRGYLKKLITILECHRASYSVIPFDWSIPLTRESLSRKGIAINAARNAAIDWGQSRARYTVVLDGDCQFTSAGLQPILEEMRRDTYTYLSIPFCREATGRQEEPQLAFRQDALLRFDETLAFGQNDKLELLFRLGHDTTPHSGHLEITGDQTRLVGEVQHHSTGSLRTEQDNHVRGQLRAQSLQELARRIRRYRRRVR